MKMVVAAFLMAGEWSCHQLFPFSNVGSLLTSVKITPGINIVFKAIGNYF
jgi:hypothetical protein